MRTNSSIIVRALIFFLIIFIAALCHDLLLELIRVYSDSLGNVKGLVDAYELLRQLEHVVSQGNNKELGIAGALLDIVTHDGDIFVVQGCVDLIHTVQGRRLIVVKGEDQTQ